MKKADNPSLRNNWKLVNRLWRADSRLPYEQPKDWHFWAPLLGLTTGMRGDEIGSLTVAHVIDVGGIVMLNAPGSKTPNAERLIPLPDVALNAGFMQLVEWARMSSGDARLFPDWALGGDSEAQNYSHKLGKWFQPLQGNRVVRQSWTFGKPIIKSAFTACGIPSSQPLIILTSSLS